MGRPKHVAILDVGKTNAKVSLVDAVAATELALRTSANPARTDGPYLHFDVARLWEFFLDSLSSLNRDAPIDAIAITAHGSAGAFIVADRDDDGLAMPILDYEHPGPDEFWAGYDAARPAFSETLSPRLPSGLNLGAQFFWQERRFPKEFAAATAYVNYPQYWAWRLSGVAATEMCSMGAHSDMWNPRGLHWSSMVENLGWTRKLAPLRPAFDKLGSIRPMLAKKLGLDPATAIQCGIHDSSASLLPHLKQRKPPFAVVSTGTWVILFAAGGDLDRLDPERDSLANVSALGEPIACARFMGGREFERLTGGDPTRPSEAELDRVLREKVMALPTFVAGCGPFPRGTGRWSQDPATLTPGERNAAASLYLAMMTAESLMLVSASGPTIVEGPFARNALYCGALSTITGRPVEPSDSGTGTMLGALMTVTGELPHRRALPAAVAPLSHPAFMDYVARWRKEAAAG